MKGLRIFTMSRYFMRFMRIFFTCFVLITLSMVGLAVKPTIASAFSFKRSLAPDNTAVTTFHNDNFRTGENLNETILNTQNVNANQFGRRVSYAVDGKIDAQPLFLPNVTINGQIHNVVYVATANDSVYAFDADATAAVQALWKTSFINPPSITTAPADGRQVGITGTPVIDRTTSTLYCVAMTLESGHYIQRLHALDIITGLDRQGSPLEIQASVPGTAPDSVNGNLNFNEKTQQQHSALLLLNGVVYISWASFSDTKPYHGWVIGYYYNGTILQQVLASGYNDTSDGQEGGIWMGGAGPSADAGGNVYVTTGNGDYNLNTGGHNAGDSFLKLNTQNGLHLSDYFTPFNQTCLSARDADLGSGGPLLLPDQPGTHPHLLLSMGKEGRIYLVDRDNMGHYTFDANLQCGATEEKRTDIDHVVQELPVKTTGALFGNMGYWGGTSNPFIYIGGFKDQLKAFQLVNGTLVSNPASASAETLAFSGATPTISSNGKAANSGIVWINSPSTCDRAGCTPVGNGVLRAYDATNLSKELYNSEQNSGRDRVDSYVKFSLPTVAYGKVFVGTQTSLDIYGLLGFQPTTTDDSVQGIGLNMFNYVGNWSHCSYCDAQSAGFYQNSESWSTDENSYVTFTFAGTLAFVYAVMGPDAGRAAISIDSGPTTSVDLYRPTEQGDQLVEISSPLPLGYHTLTIHVTGMKNTSSSNTVVAVDRVDIFQ
jgi:hypothetical protein